MPKIETAIVYRGRTIVGPKGKSWPSLANNVVIVRDDCPKLGGSLRKSLELCLCFPNRDAYRSPLSGDVSNGPGSLLAGM